MNDIKQYGDLNESELNEFLHIIESDDDDITEAEENAGENIIEEEECMPDEMLGDGAWVTSRQWEKTEEGRWRFVGLRYHLKSTNERYWERQAKYKEARLAFGRKKGTEVSAAGAAERARKRKERKIEINRAACNQEDIHISDTIPKEQLTALIAELTKEHTEMVDKLVAYINKRFGVLLRPLIPRILKTCAEHYPQSVNKCKGFMYKASEKYGEGLCFWVTPDIPYYFTQGTEQRILEKLKPEFLYRLDKAISQYNYHKNAQAEKEIKYATALVDKSIKTYFDLLKYNPFWFEKLYSLITHKKLMLL